MWHVLTTAVGMGNVLHLMECVNVFMVGLDRRVTLQHVQIIAANEVNVTCQTILASVMKDGVEKIVPSLCVQMDVVNMGCVQKWTTMFGHVYVHLVGVELIVAFRMIP
jgi:hypothetical protein